MFLASMTMFCEEFEDVLCSHSTGRFLPVLERLIIRAIYLDIARFATVPVTSKYE
jgi:hypothetical protein